MMNSSWLIGDLQEHVSMAWLIEWAKATEVFATERVEVFWKAVSFDPVSISRNRFLDRLNRAVAKVFTVLAHDGVAAMHLKRVAPL